MQPGSTLLRVVSGAEKPEEHKKVESLQEEKAEFRPHWGLAMQVEPVALHAVS